MNNIKIVKNTYCKILNSQMFPELNNTIVKVMSINNNYEVEIQLPKSHNGKGHSGTKNRRNNKNVLVQNRWYLYKDDVEIIDKAKDKTEQLLEILQDNNIDDVYVLAEVIWDIFEKDEMPKVNKKEGEIIC